MVFLTELFGFSDLKVDFKSVLEPLWWNFKGQPVIYLLLVPCEFFHKALILGPKWYFATNDTFLQQSSRLESSENNMTSRLTI